MARYAYTVWTPTNNIVLPILKRMVHDEVYTFTGLDYWTGILNWNIELDYWTEVIFLFEQVSVLTYF